MAEAVQPGYSGPLFQLSNGSSTLNIEQVGGGNFKADMTTWSAFCGGMNSTSGGITTNSACFVSKIYAEVHTSGANDLVPSVFSAPFGPVCTSGGNTCACPFRYETATGLPILYKTSEICEYTLVNDQAATGVNSGTNAMSILTNGLPNPSYTQCCGFFGLSHVYNAGDTEGTDFLPVIAYGQDLPDGADCGSSTATCIGIDEEGAGEGYIYTIPSPPGGNLFTVAQKTNSITNTVSMWLNGSLVVGPKAPAAPTLIPGTSIHLGGGGDLGQPAMAAVREFVVTNTAVSQSDVNAVFAQIKINFPTLTFGSIP